MLTSFFETTRIRMDSKLINQAWEMHCDHIYRSLGNNPLANIRHLEIDFILRKNTIVYDKHGTLLSVRLRHASRIKLRKIEDMLTARYGTIILSISPTPPRKLVIACTLVWYDNLGPYSARQYHEPKTILSVVLAGFQLELDISLVKDYGSSVVEDGRPELTYWHSLVVRDHVRQILNRFCEAQHCLVLEGGFSDAFMDRRG